MGESWECRGADLSEDPCDLLEEVSLRVERAA